jgi:NlpB/DapX lipoprotein
MKQILVILTCTVLLLAAGGCVTGNGKLPVPTANFTPKYTYAVPRDRLWQAILDALDKNHIATVSANKSSGIIQTDYIAGPEQAMVLLNVEENIRYKFNISLRDEAGGIKVNVLATIESTISNGHGSTQWKDVTPQNTERATKLENWLYQQIEDELGTS